MADKRFTHIYTYNGDFWPTVEAWAQENGYGLFQEEGGARTYKRGSGFLVSRQMVRIEPRDGGFELQGWCWSSLMARIMALFIVPAEITIASGGMTAAIPRKMARDKVNLLLGKLGSEPVK
jgi:hypothetical protein